ncbi:MAG: hypothetical protein LUG60_12750 [Erysipelotrichaceae bacterium]|nr:hypothetical protein [Erysipelotrichaceae bacterium]
MDTLNLTILKQNSQIYKEIIRISKLKSMQRRLYGYQAILEYINLYCLTQLLHISLKKHSTIEIINQYGQYDDELYDRMMTINANYNDFSEKGYDHFDIGLFLYDIQAIYEIIKNNYGDIIFDTSLDICQSYNQYINYLEKEEYCIFELKKFMNFKPNQYWYTYMETVASLSEIFNQYLNIPPLPKQKQYINEMLEIMENYYEQYQQASKSNT